MRFFCDFAHLTHSSTTVSIALSPTHPKKKMKVKRRENGFVAQFLHWHVLLKYFFRHKESASMHTDLFFSWGEGGGRRRRRESMVFLLHHRLHSSSLDFASSSLFFLHFQRFPPSFSSLLQVLIAATVRDPTKTAPTNKQHVEVLMRYVWSHVLCVGRGDQGRKFLRFLIQSKFPSLSI